MAGSTRAGDEKMAGLDSRRLADVTSIAHSLWDDFVVSLIVDSDVSGHAAKPEKQKQTDLFRTPSGKTETNDAIKRFLAFCADIFVPSGADSVETTIFPMKLGGLAPKDGNQPASWLVGFQKSGQDGLVTISIDTECLYNRLPLDAATRTKNHLILHEIGHLVLHWDSLLGVDAMGNRSMARSATPQEEAEAWWFCYAVLGYAIGQRAYWNKKDPLNADGLVWTLLLR